MRGNVNVQTEQHAMNWKGAARFKKWQICEVHKQ